MKDKKAKIVAAVVVAFLLSLILALFLRFGPVMAFFLTSSLDATLIFVILTWVIARHSLDGGATVRARKLNILAAALLIVLLSIVVVLCFQIGFLLTFIITSVANVILVFILWMFVRRMKNGRRRHMETELVPEIQGPQLENNYLVLVPGMPKIFSYEVLSAATNNFQTQIGRGGSGSVFKGRLGDGSHIAVKRIEGEVHGEREFRSEISAIMGAQHRNLVPILGYCLVSGSCRILVYEFIDNGSLDSWIFNNRSDRCLPWALRYQVAIDVAKALAYLHHDCRLRILHLDVKPENILLDDDFRARVSDFGISRLLGRAESKVITALRGTIGYMAPEWFSSKGISGKSDVYSYGMVLLELVGGRRNARVHDEDSVSYFPKTAGEKMREEKLMEVVDERLVVDGGAVEEDVKVLVRVALWCIQQKAELRPSMAVVVNMLEGYVAVTMPPPTRMFLVDNPLPMDSESEDGSNRGQGISSSTENTGGPLVSSHSVSFVRTR